MGRCLGAVQFGVDGVLVPVNDGLNDAVLTVWLLIRLIEGPLGIGFIFGEQQISRAFTVEEALAKETMPGGNGPHLRAGSENLQLRSLFLAAPRPGVAKPQGGQHMDPGRLGAPVAESDLDQDVLGLDLGVLDEDVKVPILIEDAGRRSRFDSRESPRSIPGRVYRILPKDARTTYPMRFVWLKRQGMG